MHVSRWAVMKELNAEKFCKDLTALRRKEAQNTFCL